MFWVKFRGGLHYCLMRKSEECISITEASSQQNYLCYFLLWEGFDINERIQMLLSCLFKKYIYLTTSVFPSNAINYIPIALETAIMHHGHHMKTMSLQNLLLHSTSQMSKLQH